MIDRPNYTLNVIAVIRIWKLNYVSMFLTYLWTGVMAVLRELFLGLGERMEILDFDWQYETPLILDCLVLH